MLKRFTQWLLLLSLPGGGLAAGLPAQSAENVSLVYGPFQRSVPVSEIREFAETKQATGRLAALLRLVPKSDQDGLLQALNLKLPFNVVTVNNLLNSPVGQQAVKTVSPIILRRDSAGDVAIRGALLTAAASKDGLGTLSFIENYPANTMTVDLRRLSQLANSDNGLANLLGGLKP